MDSKLYSFFKSFLISLTTTKRWREYYEEVLESVGTGYNSCHMHCSGLFYAAATYYASSGYEKRVYEHLILEYEGAESAAAIGRLFGMTADIDNLCIITLNRMIPETNILKNRSHDENVALLKKYQQRTESLGFKVGIPAEERISEEVIKSELAEDLNELPIENIAENLDSIQAKKEQYGICFPS